MEVDTHEKHDCINNPQHPAHKRHDFDLDNDDVTVAKMQDYKVTKELLTGSAKPSTQRSDKIFDTLLQDFANLDRVSEL